MKRCDCLIGLDLGTTSIKAIALDTNGQTTAIEAVPTPVARGPGGRFEHPVDELRGRVFEVLLRLSEQIANRFTPLGIAVTSMGEAGAPIDEHGRVLYPVIGWSDRRTGRQIAELRAAYTDEQFYAEVGHTLEPCWGFPKLMWLKANEPGVFAATRRWLSVADLAVFWLSGEQATDYSLASRTMAFDQSALKWSETLLQDVGIPVGLMPDAQPSGTRIGSTSAAVSLETGLAVGTPVVLGGHDRLCGAFAARAGTHSIVDSVGTAEAVVVVTPRKEPPLQAIRDAHIPRYCDVTPGNAAYVARVGLSGGLVEWIRREFFTNQGADLASYEEMMNELPDPGTFSGVVCYPAFGRAIRPSVSDDLVQGAFLGLTAAHDRGDLLLAALEAAAFSLRSNLDSLGSVATSDRERIRVEGGAVRNARWMQIRADVLGRALESVEVHHTAATGAALLAGIGTGTFPDHKAAASLLRFETRRWDPDDQRSRLYDRVYRNVYHELAPAIAPVNRALNAITDLI